MNGVNAVVLSFVGIIRYPAQISYSPPTHFPECKFEDLSTKKNCVYDILRESLHLMRFDKHHYHTEDWNLLGSIILPYDTVPIKPNIVHYYNRLGMREGCLCTHPSVVDYYLVALKGLGKNNIGDTTIQSCDYNIVIKESGYIALVRHYHRKDVDVFRADFRGLVSDSNYKAKIEVSDVREIETNLEYISAFKETSEYCVTCYNNKCMRENHNDGVSKLINNKNLLEADIVIDMEDIFQCAA